MTHEWTPERTGALIALWNEGVTASAIGRRLGVTKNAVIGKAFRLNLAKRRESPQPSPIERNVIQLAGLNKGMCRWPLGETDGTGFHFCGAAAVDGKPYCPTHCDLAYRSAAKTRKSAAVG
jgi:GcrA cell cycle regulator